VEVLFRETNWANLWVALEFAQPPTDEEQQYVRQVFESWYSLGMLGGFNASATPLQDAETEHLGEMVFTSNPDRLPSLMHNMGAVEFNGAWAKCWFDLGTADALALDVLLNALETLSLDYVSIQRVVIGEEPEEVEEGDFDED